MGVLSLFVAATFALVTGRLQLNSGTWQQIFPIGNMPKNGNSWHAAASAGGDMYTVGGDSPSGGFVQYLVQRYTASNNSWVTLGNEADLPTNFNSADLEAVGGLLFAFGGTGSGGGLLNDIYYLSIPDSNRGWKILEDDETIPQRNAHTITNIGGIMYVYGGWNGTQYFGDTWWFDTSALYQFSTANWSRSFSNSNPPARNSHSAVAFGGHLYVFGGFSHNTSQGTVFCDNPLDNCIYYNDLWVYSPMADKWTQLMPLGDKPPPRWGHSASVVGENMYVFGGTSAAGAVLNDLWAYNFPYGVWQKLNPSGSIPPARYVHTSVTIGDGVYIYGGSTFGANLKDFWVLYPHRGNADTSESTEDQGTVGLKASLVVAILLAAIIAMFGVLVYRHVSGGSTTYSTSAVTSSATYGPLVSGTQTS